MATAAHLLALVLLPAVHPIHLAVALSLLLPHQKCVQLFQLVATLELVLLVRESSPRPVLSGDVILFVRDQAVQQAPRLAVHCVTVHVHAPLEIRPLLNLVRSVSGTRLNRTGTATEQVFEPSKFEVILVHLIGRAWASPQRPRQEFE